MIIRKRLILGMMTMALLLSQTGLDAAEQGRRGGGRGRGGRQRQAEPPRNPYIPTVESQEELDEYRAVMAEESALTRLTLADAFLTAYPESELGHRVLRARVETYLGIQNFQTVIPAAQQAMAAELAFYDSKQAMLATEETEDAEAAAEARESEEYKDFVMEHADTERFFTRVLMESNAQLGRSEAVIESADKFFEAENNLFEMYEATADMGTPEHQQAVEQHRGMQFLYFQNVIGAHQTLDQPDMLIVSAKQALELDPENLAFLMVLSDTMASRPSEDEDVLEDQMDVAEEHAEKALEKVEQLLASPASMQMAEQQRAGLQTAVYATLGRIRYNMEDYDDAGDYYQQALDASPQDSASHFFLGLCFARENKGDEALESLAKAVFLKGPEETQARSMLEEIWGNLNKPEGGLPQFIEEQGSDLGGQ
jgi:tetratricopeptide (TPR) repeat protein